jgi:hypothetical protein
MGRREQKELDAIYALLFYLCCVRSTLSDSSILLIIACMHGKPKMAIAFVFCASTTQYDMCTTSSVDTQSAVGNHKSPMKPKGIAHSSSPNPPRASAACFPPPNPSEGRIRLALYLQRHAHVVYLLMHCTSPTASQSACAVWRRERFYYLGLERQRGGTTISRTKSESAKKRKCSLRKHKRKHNQLIHTLKK